MLYHTYVLLPRLDATTTNTTTRLDTTTSLPNTCLRLQTPHSGKFTADNIYLTKYIILKKNVN